MKLARSYKVKKLTINDKEFQKFIEIVSAISQQRADKGYRWHEDEYVTPENDEFEFYNMIHERERKSIPL